MTLVGLLVVAVIIGVVFVMMWGGGPSTVGEDSELLDSPSDKKTVPGRAIDKAKSVDCQQRLKQMRAGIDMYRVSSPNKSNPPTLKDGVPGVSTYYFQCPVSDQAYAYDPATGRVQCPTHTAF